MKINSSLIHDFLWRSLQVFGKYGALFIIFFISAKTLSPIDFGVYNYTLAILYALIIFSDFGISQSTSQYVASHIKDKSKSSEKVIWNMILTILCITVVVFPIYLFISYFFLSDYLKILLLLSPLILFVPLSSILDGIYRGYQEFRTLSIININVGIFTGIMGYFMIIKYGIVGACISQGIYFMLLTISMLVVYNKGWVLKLDKELIFSIIKYGLVIGIANIGYFLFTRVDIIILGQFGYLEEIGIYEIINKIFFFLILPVNILGTVVAPKNSLLFKEKTKKEILVKFSREITYLFLGGFSILIIITTIGTQWLESAFPKQNPLIFSQLLSILLYLIPLRYVGTFTNIGYITATKSAKILMFTTMIFGVINVILNLILLQYYGFIGIIYATIISQIGFIVSNVSLFYKTIQVHGKP